MTDQAENSLSEKVERVEQIINRLENSDEQIPLDEAKELKEDGEQLLDEIEEELALEDGALETVNQDG